MYRQLTGLLLHWLRVPPEPHPPHGDPASLRVFRAGRNHRNLRLLTWGLAQAGAFIGILFWFLVFSDLGERVEERRRQDATLRAATVAPAPGRDTRERTVDQLAAEFRRLTRDVEQEMKLKPPTKGRFNLPGKFHGWRNGVVLFLSRLPPWAMIVLWCFETGGLILYLLQLPVTFLLARLDYELRWYMVTDRSLRIRHGIWTINEATMSFANIQQVVVSQGPLQRLLGLSDVKVQSAGGGGGEEDSADKSGDEMHLGLFHNVTNPAEIRDLILERLRRYRESGLGDPEEKTSAAPAASAPPTPPVAAARLAAAQALLTEARALRTALTGQIPAATGNGGTPIPPA